ncbi:MAG: NYN domain-containing protein [Limnohabitans sp.]
MIAFLIDADNFSSPVWIDEAFQTLERTDGSISIRRAYGSAENLKGLADSLRIWAVRPFVNLPLPKNTTDMSLAVDAMELACMVPKPKLVVIGSGDLDFVPLVVRLRERGIKVVCVTERSKMAQDAVPAYDQVIYVGGDQVDQPIAVEPKPVATAPVRPPTKKVSIKSPAVKTTSSKPLPAKKVVAKKAPAKKSTGASSDAVTVPRILAVVPNLKAGQWQLLSEVAKVLHDEKLLAKNATSTKLFKKFPHHFELMPAVKPNQVRFILPLQ